MIYPMVPFPVTLSDTLPRFQGHDVIFMPIDALIVLCAQLKRDLLAIAKFLLKYFRGVSRNVAYNDVWINNFFQVYDTDLFRLRLSGRNYLFNNLVPRVYNPLLLLDLNAVVVKLVSITKQVYCAREIRSNA